MPFEGGEDMWERERRIMLMMGEKKKIQDHGYSYFFLFFCWLVSPSLSLLCSSCSSENRWGNGAMVGRT